MRAVLDKILDRGCSWGTGASLYSYGIFALIPDKKDRHTSRVKLPFLIKNSGS